MRRVAALVAVVALVAPTAPTTGQQPDGLWNCLRHPRTCVVFR